MKLNWALPDFVNTWIKIFRANAPSCYPIKRKRERIGRNEICPCGSLMKYKHCCLLKLQDREQKQMTALRKLQEKIKSRQGKKRGVV